MQPIEDPKCPLCHQPLTSAEYVKAHSELERKIKQKYEQDSMKQTESFNKQIKDLTDRHRQAEEGSKARHEKAITELEHSLESAHEKQFEIMAKNFDKMLKDNNKRLSDAEKRLKREHQKMVQKKSQELKTLEKQQRTEHQKMVQAKNRELKSLEKKMTADHRQELAGKTMEIRQLTREQTTARQEARDAAREEFDLKEKTLRSELREKDIEIDRANKELDDLKISRRQSELHGEAGELDLYARLTEAFPGDFLRRQTRGTSSGDIIHHIRTPAGSLDTPIVYDNKAAANVTKKDREKAVKYRKIHGTEYVIIVSANLPKTSVPNGLYGEQDGILLVHPRIITEVAKQIRSGIVEVSKLSNSKKDQENKQSRLYEYIISSEFSMMLEAFHKASEDLHNLQSKEERQHETLWKDRKFLQARLQKTANELSSSIESITQKEAVLEEGIQR